MTFMGKIKGIVTVDMTNGGVFYVEDAKEKKAS